METAQLYDAFTSLNEIQSLDQDREYTAEELKELLLNPLLTNARNEGNVPESKPYEQWCAELLIDQHGLEYDFG